MNATLRRAFIALTVASTVGTCVAASPPPLTVDVVYDLTTFRIIPADEPAGGGALATDSSLLGAKFVVYARIYPGGGVTCNASTNCGISTSDVPQASPIGVMVCSGTLASNLLGPFFAGKTSPLALTETNPGVAYAEASQKYYFGAKLEQVTNASGSSAWAISETGTTSTLIVDGNDVIPSTPYPSGSSSSAWPNTSTLWAVSGGSGSYSANGTTYYFLGGIGVASEQMLGFFANGTGGVTARVTFPDLL
ncbi:hypothetical protein EO087_08640 [Dyella sp. M7H15-1]|uniref:hypothetical protein n=1 Tax=Dyella sp. M7H15-1 TaxID=2501295 RepID=UPI001004F46D|nr:hypothetical protein [Dyella sp. M7H15-1]QAU24050.1 hypothetical protein EO087_08640 [Dyella sp. M7H15-1]